MIMNKQPGTLKNQSGVVLVISLVMLLLLTLIGITGMNSTTLEEKMAGNMRDRNIAFQAAESALKVAENNLGLGHPFPSSPEVQGSFYTSSSTLSPSTLTKASFWTDNSHVETLMTLSGNSGLGNGITPPKYIIQQLSATNTYKITVRATGGTTNAVVILQSVYDTTP